MFLEIRYKDQALFDRAYAKQKGIINYGKGSFTLTSERVT